MKEENYAEELKKAEARYNELLERGPSYYKSKLDDGLGRWCDGANEISGDEGEEDETDYQKAKRLAAIICSRLTGSTNELDVPEREGGVPATPDKS